MTKLIKWIVWVVWLAPVIYLAAVWNKVPETVPLKYNPAGEAIRFGTRTDFLAILAILLVVNVGVYFLLVNIARIDPKKKYRSENIPRMRRIAFAVTIFVSAVTCFIIYTTVDGARKFNPKMIVVPVGLLFMVVGNYIHNIKPNYFAGFRLPWTLENESNWRKTHLLAGKLWFVGGLLVVLTALLLPDNLVLICMFAIIALLTAIPAIYSYRLYKHGG